MLLPAPRAGSLFHLPHDVPLGWKGWDVFTLVRLVLVSFPRTLVMIDFRLKFHPQINVIKAMQNGLPIMGHGKGLSVPQCEVQFILLKFR